MTLQPNRTAETDIGARLALVSEMLDRAVAVLNETLADIRQKEQEGENGERPHAQPG